MRHGSELCLQPKWELPASQLVDLQMQERVRKGRHQWTDYRGV